MKIHQLLTIVSCLLVCIVTQARKLDSKSSPKKKKGRRPPDLFYVGLWEGVDTLDGAQVQRVFMPAAGENNYTMTGRVEWSEICGGTIEGNITAPPDKTINLVPALIRAFGSINSEGSMEIVGSIQCFGEGSPRISGVPASYQPISEDVILEIPAFRADFPVPLFRMSSVVQDVFE